MATLRHEKNVGVSDFFFDKLITNTSVKKIFILNKIILFHFILFYFILFHFILFYFILFYINFINSP